MITGAGSGFGKGAAIELARRGHNVIATTETEDQAATLRAEAPELTVEKLDVTDPDDCSKAADWDVDVLVNNAGAGQTGPMAEVPVDIVRHLFEVNVFGTLAVTQQVVKQMLRKGAGRILIVSSIAGLISGPSFGPYAMTKHALQAMGESMRAELEPEGIDVALINPGPYNTGFNDRMAAAMWEWFDDTALQADQAPMFKAIGDLVTTDQLDPDEVVQLLADLSEADTTELQNVIPAGILDQLAAARDAI